MLYVGFRIDSGFGFAAIVLMLSGENNFNGGINVGYGVSKKYLSSSGFNCTTLWLFSDPHVTAVSQNMFVLRVHPQNIIILL